MKLVYVTFVIFFLSLFISLFDLRHIGGLEQIMNMTIDLFTREKYRPLIRFHSFTFVINVTS